MALVQLEPSLPETLRDRVVVLTGGAIGIGRSAVEQFHAAGAKVVFGDVQDDLGQQLESQLGPTRVRYQHCDTSSYTDQLRLFELTEKEFGRVDVVVANAGISIPRDPFLPEADITVEPSTKEIDINLKGVLFTARIGMHYLRKHKTPEGPGGDLVLVSSIAGFKESGGLAIYTATKHGVLGILRGLRVTATPENIRINAICPWMTSMIHLFRARGWWATNEPADVARAIVICATANRSPDKRTTHPGAKLPFAGKILWVGGGKAYEIEDRLQELESGWLGKENSEVLAKGQAFLASKGTSWDVEKGRN